MIHLPQRNEWHERQTAGQELVQRAGARYVVPVAEHHNGFAMWDSKLTPWCAGRMGSKRDLRGELAAAVKKRNLIFGVSSHRSSMMRLRSIAGGGER